MSIETPTEPGIYRKIPFSTYRKIDAINHSLLSEIDVSPRRYQHVKKNGAEQTTAMLLGRATHTRMLEPELFDSEFAVFEGAARRGKAWDSFHKLNGHSDILLSKQMDTVDRMVKSLQNDCERICKIWDMGGVDYELTLIWIDERTGLKCKCRIDILTDVLTDLKSSSAENPEKFVKSAMKYFYHTQMSFYRRGLRANGIKCDAAQIAVAQSVELFESYMVDVPKKRLDSADAIIDGWMDKVVECEKSKKWPGFGDGEYVFDVQPWESKNGQSGKTALSPEHKEQFNKIDWSENQ